MFGKLFASTYTGSMVGSGLNVFGVWSFAIANASRDGLVELNPPLVAASLGCTTGEVTSAIDKLCAPDPASRNPDEEGRRLIQQSAFLYLLTSHGEYQSIRNDEDRREYMRTYMAKRRAKENKSVNKLTANSKHQLAHIDVDVDIDKKQDQKTAPKGVVFDGIDAQVVKDFKALRSKQRAPITATAMSGIKREAGKAGLTLEAALVLCCERGWRGFKAEWVAESINGGSNGSARKLSAADRIRANAIAGDRADRAAGIDPDSATDSVRPHG